MTDPSVDPRVALLASPMSTYQKMGVAVTVCMCMLDGFDVFAVTFAAPAIKLAWGVSQSQLGMVFSSGLLGMAAGSLLLAPAADLIGRRRLIFFSLLVMIVGTAWTSVTQNVRDLVLSRVFTGIGIGAMIPVMSSLAAEYANARNRDFCVTLMAIGFPFGGILGGFIAAFLMPAYGWPTIFLTGSGLGVVLFFTVWLLLPEPIAPMIARPKSDTLYRVNRYLARCGMPDIAELPAPPQGARAVPIKALFAPGMASVTLLITCIYFLHVITLFFVQTWVPALVSGDGISPASAALIGVWVNAGGIAGGLLLGATSMKLGLKTLVIAALSVGASMTAIFGLVPPIVLLLALGAAATGFCLQGGMMGLYALVARTFPAHMRATGTGLVIGVGRIGSAIGPAMAGHLLSVGFTRSSVAITMAVPSMLAALLLFKFRVRPPNIP